MPPVEKPRRPQPVQLSPQQQEELAKITNPTTRLTRYRELVAEKE